MDTPYRFVNIKRLCLLLLLLWTGDARAQNASAKIDSLQQQLRAGKDDSGRVKMLCAISEAYVDVNAGEGIKNGMKAKELAQQTGWAGGVAMAQGALANNYLFSGDYPRAMENGRAALQWFETTGGLNADGRKTKNHVLYLLGMTCYRQGEYPAALSYTHKALKLYEADDDKKGVADACNIIASIHAYSGDLEQGLEYYNKSLQMATAIGDKNGIAAVTSNIGDVYIKQGKFDSGISRVHQAFVMNEATGNTHFQAINLFTIANAYLMQGQFSPALDYSFRSLRIAETHNKTTTIPWNYALIATCYLGIASDTTGHIRPGGYILAGKSANLARCIEYVGKSIPIDLAAGDLQGLKDDYQTLYKAQHLAGNDKGAYDTYEKYVTIKDSIYNIESKLKMADLETARAVELKDKQIALDRLAVAKKKNERGFYIAGIIALILIVGVVFRNYRTQKRSNELQLITNRQLHAEKQKADDLLLNILPAEVAEELKEKGAAEARLFDMVTVIFTDFVNFTSAAERMTAQELVGELHECFRAFDDILNKYEIEKIKTIGDAYLAVSGLPAAVPAHAAHVVDAAIDIKEFMRLRQQEHGARTFDIRIGIHSGSVVAGIVGVKKFAYDIWGDTVNIAARMEQHGEAGMINISETTYNLVKDEFACEARGEVVAKNKGELSMYFVKGRLG